MFKQGLVLAIFTFLIATAAAKPEISFRDDICPSAPAQLNPGDIAVVTISYADHLNLRLQPGLSQEIITGIPKDASVTIIAGPVCKDGFRWYQVDYQGQSGWSVEVGADGLYSLFPTGTSLNYQSMDQNPPIEEAQTQPSMFQELGCAIWPYFCPQEVSARTWEFQQYQCTWYAAEKRPDVYNWMPLYGAHAKEWADIAIQNQIPASSANDSDFKLDYDHVRYGDLVVLQPGCAGAGNYGHVAYVESVDYTTGIIHVSEYNARYENNYDEQDLYVYWCMSFIH